MGDVVGFPPRVSRKGDFAPQSHHRAAWARDSSTSCCSETLKWRPRAGKAERSRCLHHERSTRRSEDLKADSTKHSGERRRGRAQPIRLYDHRVASSKLG
jgi:hypothetical protein